jgi:CheY-like chemotaxis protein
LPHGNRNPLYERFLIFLSPVFHLPAPIIGGMGSSMRILLVEDEEKVARFVARGLRAEGFAVDEAADGKQGLDLALSYHYDLVILDIMLPAISGTEILKRIRERGATPPVLMLTAKDVVGDKVAHFEAGADDRGENRGRRSRNRPPRAPRKTRRQTRRSQRQGIFAA